MYLIVLQWKLAKRQRDKDRQTFCLYFLTVSTYMRWPAYCARIKHFFAILCNHVNVGFIIFIQVEFVIHNQVVQFSIFKNYINLLIDQGTHLPGVLKVYENHLEYFALND